jgi:hypothetical protein
MLGRYAAFPIDRHWYADLAAAVLPVSVCGAPGCRSRAAPCFSRTAGAGVDVNHRTSGIIITASHSVGAGQKTFHGRSWLDDD